MSKAARRKKDDANEARRVALEEANAIVELMIHDHEHERASALHGTLPEGVYLTLMLLLQRRIESAA